MERPCIFGRVSVESSYLLQVLKLAMRSEIRRPELSAVYSLTDATDK
jgi:hypothetical protein